MIEIETLDHLVLTVADMDATCRFYGSVLGMQVVYFGENRRALTFGAGHSLRKINLHQAGELFAPHARQPLPGTGDLCFICSTPLHQVCEQLISMDIAIEEGPVRRTGSRHMLLSVYLRDPDGNLIELSNPTD